MTHDVEGLRRLFRQFSFPGGIPSHVAPETPGSIHEGGELGYALVHAYGAAFDNPDLLVCCVVGDGEAETGPLAAIRRRHDSQIRANILLVKSIAVMGFNYGYYVGWSPHDARFEQAERTFALMERIRGWCEAGLCRPHVDRTYRLDEAPQAMQALLERSVTGRVAVVME